MASNQALDDLSGKITDGIRMLGGLKSEADSQVRAVVEGALGHFDVVTHERMQVQEAMLRKAKEQLDALDAQVTLLESRVKDLEQSSKV